MRVAIVVNMIAPYTTPVFERLSERADTELLVVYETPMEPDRRWKPQQALPYPHTVLDSWTLDLARLAVGSGFRTRYDTYLYIPRHPLAVLSNFRPDVVVAAGGGVWSSPANILALAARRWRSWAFVPWWGSFPRERPTLPRRLAEPWVKAFFRLSDAWLAYGERSSTDLVRMGADPSRVVISPLVTPAGEIDSGVVSTHRRARETIRYLFVGRLIERKGIDLLLDAFRELDSGELWIVGDGPLVGEVGRAARANSRIRPLGHLEGAALQDVYRQVDVLVLPSRYEVWGLVVNEAQAHGLPVVTTDQVGAAPDLIDAGVNGLVVPAGSAVALGRAMQEVARWNDQQRARCAERCRSKRETYSLERAVDGIVRACALALEYRRSSGRR
jgi:glycosyltransferase involved in cell wall biosynthesis